MADPFFDLFYLFPLLTELQSHSLESNADVFSIFHLYLRHKHVLLVIENIFEEEAIVAQPSILGQLQLRLIRLQWLRQLFILAVLKSGIKSGVVYWSWTVLSLFFFVDLWISYLITELAANLVIASIIFFQKKRLFSKFVKSGISFFSLIITRALSGQT